MFYIYGHVYELGSVSAFIEKKHKLSIFGADSVCFSFKCKIGKFEAFYVTCTVSIVNKNTLLYWQTLLIEDVYFG